MYNYDSIDMAEVSSLRCDVFENVTLLPGIGEAQALTQGLGAFVGKKPLAQVHRFLKHQMSTLQLPYEKAWHESSEEVIYGGMFYKHYGHFLLETLARLWYAKKCSLPIVWLNTQGEITAPSKFTSWQKDILSALGIKNSHIFLTEPTKFAKVHFPQLGFMLNSYAHVEHMNFLRCYEGKMQKGKFVYVSRSNIRVGEVGCVNEKAIEKMLKERGWDIIYPEKFSVEQQLEILTSAEVCMLITGSAQHSLVLTKNIQTRFILLPRTHCNTYDMIANYTSDNYFILTIKKDSVSQIESEHLDMFTFDIENLRNILEKTQDFTKNPHDFEEWLVKPKKLLRSHVTPSDVYSTADLSISKDKKLFFRAMYLYIKKKYREAYRVVTYLQKEIGLENFMYNDFFQIVEMYHTQQGLPVMTAHEKNHCLIADLYRRIERKTDDIDVYIQLSELLRMENRLDAACLVVQNAIEIYPAWDAPYKQLADIYDAKGEVNTALDYAYKAVEKAPHILSHRVYLAELQCKNGAYDAAIQLMTEIVTAYPYWSEAYAKFSYIYDAKGEVDKAIEYIHKAIALETNNRKHTVFLADLLRKKKDYIAMSALMTKVMAEYPQWGAPYAQFSYMYTDRGALNKAILYARKAVETEPNNLEYRVHLSDLLRKKMERFQ